MDTRGEVPKVLEYRLTLSVDFDRLTFDGLVEIDLEGVDGPLAINSRGLSIRRVSVQDREIEWVERADLEELRLVGVPPGSSTLRLEYSGRATEVGLIGLYRSRYGSSYILTTQSAPTGARMIFPCLDRPDRKAPIQFTATVPSDVDVIFNTPVENEVPAGATKTLRFAPTPPMSTYLFYLGVGRFDALRGPADRVQISVYAPKGRAAAGAFGLEHATRLLPAFESYFGIDYPLPKLDLIAVPEYAYGAMENWGAIVFRDMYLLVDGATSTRIRRHALDTIAHEIAHQWFGNLVTMEWWTDIWLNESFATFLEMRILARLYPTYGSLENYLGYWLPLAFEGDSLPHTHPVTTEVRDPKEISQVFDEISYGKGSAVLRMIETYLGEETFRQGVSDYLRRFRHGNARSEDLWTSLDRVGPEPVRPLLEEWTHRPGLPLLSATLEPGAIRLRQRRFAADGSHTEETWPIPLTYEVNGRLYKQRVSAAETRLAVEAPTSLHLNPGAAGFYRTLYDGAGYDLLLKEFVSRAPADQWIVLLDLAAFVFSGDVPFSQYARFVKALEGSAGYLPLRQIAESLLGIWLVLGDSPTTIGVTRSFLRAQFERLGSRRRPGENETDGVVRERVTAALVWADPPTGRTLADAYRETSSVDADLRPAATTAFARFGGREEYATLRRALNDAVSEGEASDYELALVSFPDPGLVQESLDLLDAGKMNRAHLPTILRRAAWAPEGRDVAWRWIQRRLVEVAEETRGTGFASYVFEYCLPYVGISHPQEVLEWVAVHPVAESERGARKGLGLLGATQSLRRRVA